MEANKEELQGKGMGFAFLGLPEEGMEKEREGLEPGAQRREQS